MKSKLYLLILLLAIALGFQACQPGQHNHDHSHYHPHPILYATLYQQQAAEYRALCYQAFNMAAMQLDKELEANHDYPLAIVLDIDETVLDNSPYQAQAIKEGFGYPKKWAEWIELAVAEPLPGVLAFLQHAEANQVAIFYITNRKEEFREATLRNLQKMGIPFADDEHLLMRTVANDKEPRRRMVSELFHIAMLIGDNLGDFHAAFDTDQATDRMQLTEDKKQEFGSRWIVLPNAIYGSWVNALEGYEHGIHPDELAKQLQENLKGF
jgi:5'-nucleotidase (lipoprotein e(P4) family)